VRKQLQERKIKFCILFPVRLKVYHPDGKFKVSDNPRDAAEGLSEYGVNMEVFDEEQDLESTLRAAGWETHRSKGRKKPTGDLICGVKTLLDSLSQHARKKDKGICGGKTA